MKLHVIPCSTRPGRASPEIATWFYKVVQPDSGFETALVDLKDFNLPIFDEPNHPRLQQYQHAHTKKWAASVKSADAFVFVTPEYNYGPPPSLLNALDYLSVEWAYKAVAFVSYGGISGGLRGVEVTKQIVTTLKMTPILPAVSIPNFRTQFTADGLFSATQAQTDAVPSLLAELYRVAAALKPLRHADGRST